MAIQYINSGDTNDTGRLKANAAFDEIVVGTTLSTNAGEYILDQFDGGQIIGTVNFPDQTAKPSIIYALGSDADSTTFKVSPGNFLINNNFVGLTAQTITIPANVTANDLYHTVYVDELSNVTVTAGQTAIQVLATDKVAVIGLVIATKNNGPVLVESSDLYREAGIKVQGDYLDLFGGLNYTLGGGYVPREEITVSTKDFAVSSTTSHSFAYGLNNQVYTNFGAIFGGRDNKIESDSELSVILGGSGNTVSAARSGTIAGSQNTIDSGLTEVVILNGYGVSADTTNAYNKSVIFGSAHIKSGVTFFTRKIDANYTAATSDYHLAVATSSGATTITLPPSPVSGHEIIIKDADGSCAINNITLLPNNPTTIDGATGITLTADYISLTLMYNSTFDTWMIT